MCSCLTATLLFFCFLFSVYFATLKLEVSRWLKGIRYIDLEPLYGLMYSANHKSFDTPATELGFLCFVFKFRTVRSFLQ